ncbi:cytochrome c biogenesis protein ResB [Litorihabitans aurantiacus]|uniref:Cytochrome c biogenesis protein ResB n=1 Tax=Litorihabitans aurantiacus TaxID=1930061 RepID=A0AA37XG12_9MICO|nr:cytochrome c biogenesis protein ResB [Litorihabitans aurantiacus]GMA32406.1 cytochrome c biogenesis protein ResB [Litorihabitans aurantiacus]
MRAGYRPEGLVGDEPERGSGPAQNAAPGPTPTPARFGPIAWLRWTWRQLTSMRVALLLLLLLAVVALPGTFFPQRPQDPARVAQYYVDNPSLAPVLERWGLFDVFSSPWFSAVYLLLFVSLVGCIVPRSLDHVRALRRPPPAAPRRFTRFPVRDAFASGLGREEAVTSAVRALKGYRLRRTESADGAVTTLSGERGYTRETGNIVFHLSLVGLLVAVGYGSFVHYRGQVLVVEGDTFANSQVVYDSFESGPWFDESGLDAFRMRLDGFSSEFDEVSGQAADFRADVTLTEPGADPRPESIRVNHPLRTGGASVYLMGNGFAPDVTVTDAGGDVAFSGPVPFVVVDQQMYDSRGVIKVPDTQTGDQIGLSGVFLPTAVVDPASDTAFSISPEPTEPLLVLDVWYGNLGLDDGVPQNVYQLDTQAMRQVTEPGPDGEDVPVRVVVAPGQTVDLPDGLGTLTFNDLPRYVGLDLRYDPTLPFVLTFSLLALAGLSASLFLPRRRVFVRIGRDDGGRTVVTAAALARGDDPGLARELTRVLDPLRPPVAEGPRPHDSTPQDDEGARRG